MAVLSVLASKDGCQQAIAWCMMQAHRPSRCYSRSHRDRSRPERKEFAMQVKAAVLYEENKPMVIEEVELHPPKRAEVLVKIGAAGICRSDLHFIKGEAHFQLPAILGHEGSGTVEAAGEGGTAFQAGDRVNRA